jgi:hypothetical protein
VPGFRAKLVLQLLVHHPVEQGVEFEGDVPGFVVLFGLLIIMKPFPGLPELVEPARCKTKILVLACLTVLVLAPLSGNGCPGLNRRYSDPPGNSQYGWLIIGLCGHQD